jgi:energy-coupling factor transport system ATP-binding protein
MCWKRDESLIAGSRKRSFKNIEWLKEKQLGVPTATEFAEELMAKGMNFATLPLTAEELADAIVHYAGENAHDE